MEYLISEQHLSDSSSNEYMMADVYSNLYIPIAAINRKQDNFYYFPDINNYTVKAKSAVNVLQSLVSRNNVMKTHMNDNTVMYVSRGLILDGSSEILLCLSMCQEKVLASDLINTVDEGDVNFDYSNTILLLSTDFLTNPSYLSVLKMVQKSYINLCYSKGVEVRIMTSEKIKQNTFANNFKIEYNSISEMEECLKNEVELLFSKKEDYFDNHLMFNKQGIIPLLEVKLPGYPIPVEYVGLIDYAEELLL